MNARSSIFGDTFSFGLAALGSFFLIGLFVSALRNPLANADFISRIAPMIFLSEFLGFFAVWIAQGKKSDYTSLRHEIFYRYALAGALVVLSIVLAVFTNWYTPAVFIASFATKHFLTRISVHEGLSAFSVALFLILMWIVPLLAWGVLYYGTLFTIETALFFNKVRHHLRPRIASGS